MQVTINNKLMSDYGLTFIHKHIDSPKPKRSTINVPLTDGIYDLTKSVSDKMFYDTRTIEMEFEIIKPRCEWAEISIALFNDLHGINAEVEFYDDPAHIWTGFLTVGSLEDHKSTANITLTLEANPYRRTKEPILKETLSVSSTTQKTYEIKNKVGYCMIKASNFASITDAYENYFDIYPSPTKFVDYGIVLRDKTNALSFSVSGGITATIEVEIFGGDL